MMKLITSTLLIVMLALVGCGGGGGAEAEVSEMTVAEVEQQSSGMSVDDLKSKVAEYEKALQAKLADLEPIQEKLKAIPMTEMMGEEAKALQADILKISEDVTALKDRLQVYYDALKEQGVDIKNLMK
ncbi:MAG: hypothetical protein AB3N63_15215 [Puniceicoccaceae bacterium]